MEQAQVRKKRGPKPDPEKRYLRFKLYLPPEEGERLRREAEKECGNISEYVRRRLFSPRSDGVAMDESRLSEAGRRFLDLARADGWENLKLSREPAEEDVVLNIDENSWPCVFLVARENGSGKKGEAKTRVVGLDDNKNRIRKGKTAVEDAINEAGEDLAKILAKGLFRVGKRKF